MRFIIPLSLFVLLLTLALPLFLISSPDTQEREPPPEEAEDSLAASVDAPSFSYALGSNPVDGSLDEALVLRVLLGDEIQELTMAAYLQGVVAAEMPARFHPEALKAQAVAARTYTLHRMLVIPTPRHPEAYVCGDYACCKAYHSPERRQERWGVHYPRYSEIIAQAVAQTDGLILVYDDLPILAAFHSSSYGFTEASGAIWGERPYLQSVRTFEGAQEVPNYYSTVELSFSEFRQIASGFPGVRLSEDEVPYWISDLRHTDSGRLASLKLGGVNVTGAEFRRLFSLRSTAISFSFDAAGVTITTGGYGHGVGMSQFGANTLAELGLGFQQILDWYYTEVSLIRLDNL